MHGDLLALGAGSNKGQVLAYLSFLNAHHPEFGRIKAEQLARILSPLIKRFYAAVMLEAGEKIGARIKLRMEEIAEARLADFSD